MTMMDKGVQQNEAVRNKNHIVQYENKAGIVILGQHKV